MNAYHDAPIDLASGLGADSIAIFQSTLYPVLRTHCGSCHGVGQVPQFAVQSVDTSHRNILPLVNLSNAASSRIVSKIQAGHSGIASSVASILQTQITAWANELASAGTQPPQILLEAKFSSIHALILVPKCVGCHNPAGKRPSENYSDYNSTLSTGKVRPNNANDSAMYTECASGKMPEDAPNLSPEELTVLRDWINSGALDN